jgi:hypothetical protein
MNQEETFTDQLNEVRAAQAEKAERRGKAVEETKGILSKLLNNPLLQWLIPILAEVLTGGIAPGWTAFVLWNYITEKAGGKTPNLAEYLIIGIPAVIVDAFQILFTLSGLLSILSYAIILPCLFFLYLWKFHKVGLKGLGPTKAKK